jgi:hypothetical protein
MIEFISYEEFPDDNYTKELVYIQINGVRYGYVSKSTKSGAVFWDEISVGVSQHGEKKYFKAFKFDSEFLRDDILAFLKARSWQKKTVAEYIQPQFKPAPYFTPTTPTEIQDELPF